MIYYNGIILLLVMSLLINILFIWYLRQLLARFSYICTNIFDLKRTVDVYMNHLSIISELEMFYQDPNIEQLMEHTKDLITQLRSYEEFYELLGENDIGKIPPQTVGNSEGTEDEQRNDREPTSPSASQKETSQEN